MFFYLPILSMIFFNGRYNMSIDDKDIILYFPCLLFIKILYPIYRSCIPYIASLRAVVYFNNLQ